MESNYKKKRAFSTLPKALPSLRTPQLSRKPLLNSHTSALLTRPSPSTIRVRTTTEAPSRRIEFGPGRDGQLGSARAEARLRSEIEAVLEMFRTINRLRQAHGVIELREQDEDEGFYLEAREVPYDAQLSGMNEEICRLKREISQRMDRVLAIAKPFAALRGLISEALEEQGRSVLQQNRRGGKVAAMKAQRRLREARRREQAKIGL